MYNKDRTLEEVRKMLESENTEFKRQATDDIYKEVVAFANTEGGILSIGVDDHGNAVGLDPVDEI